MYVIAKIEFSLSRVNHDQVRPNRVDKLGDGPEPHDGKPVGTVFIGVFGPAGSAAHERHYTGDRAQIRAQATYDAILLLQAVASA